ncbi:hypothetical protein PHMEG_00014229 [Phytophthora megakarya]|uniref:Uncharacterized protein n=1 Tax=Phytophthora megakarya TaxID=4795 RepID=A0A225W6C9_9STRA|nr:hypothetical protein PHMEG_00014229 [Phytophthora megakarya]
MGTALLSLVTTVMRILSIPRPSHFHPAHDAAYKLSQVGYPEISDKARQFHLLGIFIGFQLQEPYRAEVLALLRKTYTSVTGKPMRICYVMGDADGAQWNMLQSVFGPDNSFSFLIQRVYDKTRTLASDLAVGVLVNPNELHFTVSKLEFRRKLADIPAKWGWSPSLKTFSAYVSKVWLNERVWQWHCFHTPSSFAATNKPCETNNAAIKRDTTLRRKIKMGSLISQLLLPCQSKSVSSKTFYDAALPPYNLVLRANALAKDKLLTLGAQQHLGFLEGTPIEAGDGPDMCE